MSICVLGIFVADLCFFANNIPTKGQTILGNKHIIGPGGKGSNEAIAAAQASADAAGTRANEAFQAAQTARRVAERGVEMANQNQAALRALNDKIDRMFETISRK